MNAIVLILELFGGLILIFGIGFIIGHLFKFDRFWKDQNEDPSSNETIKRRFILIATVISLAGMTALPVNGPSIESDSTISVVTTNSVITSR